jgi:signal transduction histidine kinase
MNAWSVFKRMPIVVSFACIATVMMLLISEGAYWQSVKRLDALVAMGGIQSGIQDLQQNLLNAESDQRGYLLTGRAEYLQPYNTAVQKIGNAIEDLDRHYAGDPDAMALLAPLHALTTAKLADLSTTMGLYDQGQGDAAKALMLTQMGKAKMDAIRALTAELLVHETRKVEASKANLYRTLMTGRIGMAMLSAISLLALFLYLRQTFALKRTQEQQQDLMQIDHDRLEIVVAQRTAQLTELTHHLQTAREDERNRLARNLHDELGALLTSAKLDAARIKSRLAGTAPEALERLAHLVDALNSSIALGRRIIEDLRPSTLSNLGLVPTLEILAREFAERSGLQTHCTLEPAQLDATAELMIYRLMQEAITNISKYAKASHVWLSLTTVDGLVQASVRDDGIGFDTTVPPRSAYGLVGMRYRVEAEGGTLRVESTPGRGTLIQVTLPPAEASQPAPL